MIRVDLLPAAYGDCIVLSYGTETVRHVLIDAGTTPTWEAALRPHLVERGIDGLELFVLTHIDADHIAGAIPMLEDRALPVRIGEVWFNGWNHLPKRFLSVRQGEAFSRLIQDRGIPWNAQFGGGAVCVEEDSLPVRTLGGGLRLTVLSPTPGKLSRLARSWKKEVDRHFLGGAGGTPRRPRFLTRNPTTSVDVPKLAATKFRSDSSVPNGSSIALLAEYDGSSILLAGDAHAPELTRSIATLLVERNVERLKLDAFKVSHHGSRGNTSVGMLDLIDCKRYLVSSNGAVHQLPDNEAIARIIQHGGGRPRLFFNYRSPRTQCWDDEGLRNRYRYKTKYGSDGWLSVGL